MHLTRHPDIHIQRHPAESAVGWDLLVHIEVEGRWSGRVFAVVVEAQQTLKPKPLSIHEKQAYRLALKAPRLPVETPFPVCLFVFSVETDEGYYRWLLRLASRESGGAVLELDQSDIYWKLSADEIQDIFSQVQEWYDKRHVSAMCGEGRKP